jgi:membrane associated rhomboid family serine protease
VLPLRDHLPTRRVPIVNYALILANIAVFVWAEAQFAGGVDPEAFARAYAAWLVIALFFVANLWNAMATSQAGGVAFMAHVGGFVAGILLVRLFMAGRSRMDDYGRWQEWGRRRTRGAW